MVFDFERDYVLENDRVCLYPLTHSHFEELEIFAKEEPELWAYSMVDGSGSEGMNMYIQQALELRKACQQYPFVVFDKHQNAIAGSTRFYDIQLGTLCMQLGYTWFGKKFQGTGINLASKQVMLQFAFENLNMQRVELRADSENLRSISAMKKLGFTFEGLLRSNGIRRDGTRRSSSVFSMLIEEWLAGPTLLKA